jgi:oligopeptide transport system substrate-binding protein
LRRVASPETLSSYAFLLEPIENFSEVNAGERPIDDLGVAATGPGQLTIRLKAATGHFLSLLTMSIAYPVHASSASSGGFGDPASVVVNGPYKVRSRQPMGPITLERNPHFREAAAVKIDEIVYLPVVDEVAELNMYRAGELDITHTVPRAHIDALRTDRADELQIAPMLAFYYLALDVTEPPFDDRALRRALSLAIDRDELVRIIGRGEVPAYGIAPPGIPGHSVMSYELQDLDRGEREQLAREWLAKSAYASSLPELTYIYDADSIHGQIAIVVTAMWREVLGIDVQLDKREWQYFLDTRHDRSQWQLMRFSWFGDYNDAMTFFEILRSDSPQNLAGYENAEYDRLVAAAAGETEPAAREQDFADAERVLLNDMPIVPLYFYVSKHMVDPAVSGFEDNLLDRHPSRYLDINR